MTDNTLTADSILQQALTLAQQSSWQSFSLNDLALQLDCNLSDISQFYRSKDDIAEALFNKADEAMLDLTTSEAFQGLSSKEKLLECMMTWFLYLAPYKPIVKEIFAYKLEPGHFHLQAHGITRVSRTVQWFMEASEIKSTGLKRSIDEIAITSTYLVGVNTFLCDKSAHLFKTKNRLIQLLK